MKKILLSGIAILFLSIYASAQTPSYTPGEKERLSMTDGSVLIGKVTDEDEESITMTLDSGAEVTIDKKSINKRTELEDLTGTPSEKFTFRNPNPSRYYFAPSAINLRKGEGYYQNIYIGLNSFNYGVTDYFTIGGGFELSSLMISLSRFGGLNITPAVFVNPKFGFEVAHNLHLGAGVLVLSLPAAIGPNFNTGFNIAGIGYGLATYGNVEDNMTLGMGYAFVNKEAANRPVFMLGGMKRVTNWLSLITENYYIPVESPGTWPGTFGYGARFMNRKVSFDVMFVNHPEIFKIFLIGIPVIGAVVKF